MKMLKTPVVLPDYLRSAYEDMTNALADQFEKHSLDDEEIAAFLAAQLISMLPLIGKTEITAVMHTTLPVRIGLLDAHESSVELMKRLICSDDAEIETYISHLRAKNMAPESFSSPEIARRWLCFFLATN